MQTGPPSRHSTSHRVVIHLLHDNDTPHLTITTRPFPTTLSAFLEALQANTSVEELAFETPAVLEDLPETYLRTLTALPNLRVLSLGGMWKDETLCRVFEAFHRNRASASADSGAATPSNDLELGWGKLGGCRITSRESLVRLTNVLQQLPFRLNNNNVCYIETSLPQDDLTPFIMSLIGQAEEVKLPTVVATMEGAEACNVSTEQTVFFGTVPTNCLEELLYSSPQVKKLCVGCIAFHPSPLVFQDSLEAFASSSSRQQSTSSLQELSLFLSPDVPVQDYQFLVEFCQQSAPKLVRLDVRIKSGRHVEPLAQKHPQVHVSVEFQLSLNASGIRAMIQNYSDIPKREWVDLLFEKRHNLSILYSVIRQVPSLFKS